MQTDKTIQNMALSNAHFSHIDGVIGQIQFLSVTQVSEIEGKLRKLSDACIKKLNRSLKDAQCEFRLNIGLRY